MSERLRRTQDVRAVLSRGRAAHGRHVVVRAVDRGDRKPCRWTVSASRRVGSAVERNRAKRRLRAVVRTLDVGGGLDLVVIARASAVECEFAELIGEVEELIPAVRESGATEVRA